MSEDSNIKKNSKAWYLAPIFIGIIGGFIMYLVLKDDNPKMAKKGLILSIVLTVASVVLYIVFFAVVMAVGAAGGY